MEREKKMVEKVNKASWESVLRNVECEVERESKRKGREESGDIINQRDLRKRK